MSYIFNLTDLSGDYNNNNYDTLINKIDASLNNILTLCRDDTGFIISANADGSCRSGSSKSYKDVDENFIKDVYTFSSFLKSQNNQNINSLNDTLQQFRDLDNNEFDLNIENVKKLKDIVGQNKKQNSENIKMFLETYLYVILKIIFIIILLILVYQYSEITIFAFSFNEAYQAVKNKISNIKNNGLEIKNKLNNKIQELNNKDPMKKLPKKNILNNYNNNNNNTIKIESKTNSQNNKNSQNKIATVNIPKSSESE